MKLFSWLTWRFSNRGKAQSFYKRGLEKAKKHDHEGAIGDYTATIELLEAPVDVKAMALFNRALAHVASGDERSGLADLDAILAMDEALINVKTMARQKLARIKSRSGDSDLNV